MAPRILLSALASLLAVGLIACDDEPGAADPTDMSPATDMAPIPDEGPPSDSGPEPDGGMPSDGGPPEACRLDDIEPGNGLVATARGWVQGRETDGIWTWQGIPYVAPPVGELRFRPPEEHACWDGVKLTGALGAKCPQVEISLAGTSVVGEEDCLTLNIWSPVTAPEGTARPVLFFIHGGGNIVGSAAEDVGLGRLLYDGAPLAARGDAVVVTMQYRLGPLGFMSLPELDAEGSTSTSGNAALLDQIAALRWVEANIAGFGGDPDRVMVFGESAGAVNTCMMLASPLTEGLMHRALMQSGACDVSTKAAAQAASADAAVLFGCEAGDRLACLRALDAGELVERASGSVGIGSSPTENGLSWGPTLDGYVLTEDPLDRFAAGSHAPIPAVVGSNADEMAATSINRVQVDSPEDYTRAVRLTFGIVGAAGLDRIFEIYPVDDFESPNDAFIQVTTDAFFTCGARSVTRALAAGQGDRAPVYRYFFARRFETGMGQGRAQHGIELVYVFRTLTNIPGFRPNADELAVADQMMDGWLNFAADGDPSGGAAVDWPPYALDTETTYVFDAPPSLEDGVRGAKCDLWDELVAGLGG